MNEPQPIMQSRKSALVKRKPFFLADAIEAGPKALVACYNLAARGFDALIGNNALKKNALTHPRQSIAALALTSALAVGGAGGMTLSPALFNVTAPAAPAGTIDIIQSGILERPELRINMSPLGGFEYGRRIGFGKSITLQGERYTYFHHRNGVISFTKGWNSDSAPYTLENIDELSASYTQATRTAAGLGAAGAGILLLLGFQGAARYRISVRRREEFELENARHQALPAPAKKDPLRLT